uniref:Neur_chan_LBD domain-containing protein n=2 Tax=Strongyloides papillosus TaxID=174720 RepID=A0A0N5C4N5_STREA
MKLTDKYFYFILLSIPSFAIQTKNFESQLYEDLLYDYNKIPRPVKNSSDILLVHVGASLIRIIDVDEKNQILTTNVWLEMNWIDAKLQWDPKKYGGIKTLHIPSDLLWTPDLVLYNNAAGDPDITIFTDALVAYDGRVFWHPPAIYKSFCPIDVTWFPYDSQKCNMKFGAWSYTGFYVDLRQLPREEVTILKDKDGSDIEYLERGMDLSFFYKSAEWDLLSLTSERHSVLYASCCGPEKYVDITYNFELRRKTLFFTCNLIVPCFLISMLTTFVFYLPDHKITFSISILVTLTVFFLVLIDIMPPTSLVIPMFGRYLITTMILVALSTVVSVITVNFRFRSGSAHKMSPWIKTIFLKILPKLIFISRPKMTEVKDKKYFIFKGKKFIRKEEEDNIDKKIAASSKLIQQFPFKLPEMSLSTIELPSIYKISEKVKVTTEKMCNNDEETVKISHKKKVEKIIFMNLLKQICFIAKHFQNNEEEAEISNDWTFVAMVLDRLFLIIFSIFNVATFLIILEAPSLYDTKESLNISIPNKPLGQANIYSMSSHKLFG